MLDIVSLQLCQSISWEACNIFSLYIASIVGHIRKVYYGKKIIFAKENDGKTKERALFLSGTNTVAEREEKRIPYF